MESILNYLYDTDLVMYRTNGTTGQIRLCCKKDILKLGNHTILTLKSSNNENEVVNISFFPILI